VLVLDPDDARDMAARGRFFDHFGGVAFTGTPPMLLAVKIARVFRCHRADVSVALRWPDRALRRSGGLRRLIAAAAPRSVRPMTFQVHSFMDTSQVAPAWESYAAPARRRSAGNNERDDRSSRQGGPAADGTAERYGVR
jgi:hypothetical protein